jgi:hypothetical protein
VNHVHAGFLRRHQLVHAAALAAADAQREHLAARAALGDVLVEEREQLRLAHRAQRARLLLQRVEVEAALDALAEVAARLLAEVRVPLELGVTRP